MFLCCALCERVRASVSVCGGCSNLVCAVCCLFFADGESLRSHVPESASALAFRKGVTRNDLFRIRRLPACRAGGIPSSSSPPVRLLRGLRSHSRRVPIGEDLFKSVQPHPHARTRETPSSRVLARELLSVLFTCHASKKLTPPSPSPCPPHVLVHEHLTSLSPESFLVHEGITSLLPELPRPRGHHLLFVERSEWSFASLPRL